jgi:nicotinamidase/pyrazinamidase
LNQNVHFLLIDPQNDFCDLPAGWLPRDPITEATAAPALPVSGAHADMLRLAGLIRDCAAGIADITITLDSHHRFDIAHPTFWQTGAGGIVAPFTPITAVSVRTSDFAPKAAAMLPRALAYLDELERRGRYTLMVWPVHCEIGSWGHNIHPAVKAACNRWEDRHMSVATKVNKGSNPWTEHYSALQAEVPSDDDAATQLNRSLIAKLDEAELIVIAGEASSHCVKATTEHLVGHLPSRQLEKITLLTDCMSPVAGFGAQHEAFLATMAKRGVNLATSVELRARLASAKMPA